VLQLLTLEEFHYAIARIIKQIICQEGLTSTKGNHRDVYIGLAIHLLCDQPSSLLNRLSTFSIYKRMVVNTKMNCHSWHKLESMHNIIDFPIAINDTKGRSMIEFVSKQRSRRNHCHLTYNYNRSAFTTLEGSIVKGKTHKVLTIILHTPQVT
jgi:hypothetical protein